MLGSFRHATFRALQGDSFRVDVEGLGSLHLELGEAAEFLPQHATPGRRTPFSIVFLGSLEPVLPQRIYPMTHPVLGSFDLFLVPIGPEAGAMRYEAVFI